MRKLASPHGQLGFQKRALLEETIRQIWFSANVRTCRREILGWLSLPSDCDAFGDAGGQCTTAAITEQQSRDLCHRGRKRSARNQLD